MNAHSTDVLTVALQSYVAIRQTLLAILDCPQSNRDPLAEFSERYVARLVGGSLAASVVQKGYDVIGEQGEKIQVKYLANSRTRWVNLHHIKFTDDMDFYALVIFENFSMSAVLIFPKMRLSEVCSALGKKHPNQERSLQFTQANFRKILANREMFQSLDVRIYAKNDDTNEAQT